MKNISTLKDSIKWNEKKYFLFIGLIIAMFNSYAAYMLVETKIYSSNFNWNNLRNFLDLSSSFIFLFIITRAFSYSLAAGYAIEENRQSSNRILYKFKNYFSNGIFVFTIVFILLSLYYITIILSSGASIIIGALVYYVLFAIFINITVHGWKQSLSAIKLENILRNRRYAALCFLMYIAWFTVVPTLIFLVVLVVVISIFIASIFMDFNIFTLPWLSGTIFISFLYNSCRAFFFSIFLRTSLKITY